MSRFATCCRGITLALLPLLACALPALARAQPAACPQGTLPAYAHNDYLDARPLTDALALGFRGVEADVFLIDTGLRVGHDRRAARRGATLEALYLAPLQALVARCGRLTADGRPFLLTIEVKETSPPTHDALVALLGRYRVLLEAAPASGGARPPLAVILVGWHPPASPSANGVDARLGRQQKVTHPDARGWPARDPGVRLLSVDYGKTMGRWWVTDAGRRRWLASLRAAKAAAPDRLLRVYDVPVDRGTYAALLAAGVDLIGTRQPAATARLLAPPTAP